MHVVPGNLSEEEMDARIAELQKKHAEGALEEEHYADDDELTQQLQIEAVKGEDATGEVPAKEPAKEVTKPQQKDTGAEELAQEEPAKDPAEEEVLSTEGLDDKAAQRVRNAQAWGHAKAQEAAALAKQNKELLERIEKGEKTGEVQREMPKIEIPDIEGMTEEQAEQLAEDYPELAPVIKTTLGVLRQNEFLRQQLEKTNATVEQQESRNRETEEQARQRTYMEQIKRGDATKGIDAHPDAEAIQQSEDFYGWVNQQSEMIQQAVYDGGSVRDIAFILSSYKRDVGISPSSAAPTAKSGDEPAPQPTGKSKLEQAREVASPSLPDATRQLKPGNNPSGKKIYSLKEIDAIRKDPSKIEWLMSEEGDKWERDVIEAMRDGRIKD